MQTNNKDYQIIYTDDLPKGFAGRCEYPLNPFGKCTIKIRPKYKNDKGLLEHELTHVKQWEKLNFIHVILYELNEEYRYRCELEAYKAQIKEYNYKDIRDAMWIVEALTKKYGLEISASKVMKDVQKLIARSEP